VERPVKCNPYRHEKPVAPRPIFRTMTGPCPRNIKTPDEVGRASFPDGRAEISRPADGARPVAGGSEARWGFSPGRPRNKITEVTRCSKDRPASRTRPWQDRPVGFSPWGVMKSAEVPRLGRGCRAPSTRPNQTGALPATFSGSVREFVDLRRPVGPPAVLFSLPRVGGVQPIEGPISNRPRFLDPTAWSTSFGPSLSNVQNPRRNKNSSIGSSATTVSRFPPLPCRSTIAIPGRWSP